MKVQGAGRPQVGQVQDKSPVKGSSTPQVEKSSGERVAVSSLSKLLAQVRAPDSPDAQKVEKLRESIRTGEFHIDREKVAETMVHEES
jgi:flagellar biosynthesis anti-sigma factor FlgM